MGSYFQALSDFQTADEPIGRRLIPHIIDKAAATKPDEECFQIPRSSEPTDGWQIVTWKQYAGVIDGIAQRIVEVCGPAAKGEFPVISYIGPNDARYVVSNFSSAFMTSSHNSADDGRLSLSEPSRRVIRHSSSRRATHLKANFISCNLSTAGSCPPPQQLLAWSSHGWQPDLR
jgi:hypothetical protein